MYLKVVGSIDKKRAWKGVIHIDPFAIMFDLKPAYTIVDEERQEAMIRMRGQPYCKLRLWARGVKIYNKYL